MPILHQVQKVSMGAVTFRVVRHFGVDPVGSGHAVRAKRDADGVDRTGHHAAR